MNQKKIALVILTIFGIFTFIACNPKSQRPGEWYRKYSTYQDPTNEPILVPSPNPTQEVLQRELIEEIKSSLEELKYVSGDVEEITDVRIIPTAGYLEIRLVTSLGAYEAQPFFHFRFLQTISQLFISDEFRDDFIKFTNSDDFYLNLTTSTNHNDRYAYNSMTRWDLMEGLHNGTTSFQEWKTESNAGFVH